ncbi:serine/threonine-protein kinase ATR [Aristolochia californica]|uniref:serine/threonine-protein kinase ATR n=1 Tax=Aristolochia californica TaxID=171875 RepID=UPI0035E208C1
MASLSSLVHELRERIAASSGSPSERSDDLDPLEVRFRAVLPNLLQAYVFPSAAANEREVTAVLKLLSHTARNFPGVFFHGKAAAVLPIIGRILPFFAEPTFRSRHGVIFDAVGSLLSLLRTGDREAYRQFFSDAMLAVEDLLYVALLYTNKSDAADSPKVSLTCFNESFSGIAGTQALFGDIPSCCKPEDKLGVVIDLTDTVRWQPFATWIIKLLTKCLTEGTLYVEGLTVAPFVSATCSLLRYDDAALHVACFDFACITTAVMDAEMGAEVVPYENLIRSITVILSKDKEELSRFRTAAYDSSVGACLRVLYSSCDDEVVKITAEELVAVFAKSIQGTDSPELKVAMCHAYIRIVKVCPVHIWRPEILVHLLSTSKPCLPLIKCIRMAIDMLGPDCIVEESDSNANRGSKSPITNGIENYKVGQKRLGQILENSRSKRQKAWAEAFNSDDKVNVDGEDICIVTPALHKEYADYMRELLFPFVDALKVNGSMSFPMKKETSLMALSLLCIVFCNYPYAKMSLQIFQQLLGWWPWIYEQAKRSNSLTFDLSVYLDAVHNILLLQSFVLEETTFSRNEGDCCKDGRGAFNCILKLPWSHSLLDSNSHPLWKTRCLSIQIFSMIGVKESTGGDLEVLDLAHSDEAEEVRAEAIISIPVMVLCTGRGILPHMCRRLEFLSNDSSNLVKQYGVHSIGYLFCLLGSDDLNGSSCKLFLSSGDDREVQAFNILFRGFWCPQCDKRVKHDEKKYTSILTPSEMEATEDRFDYTFVNLLNLFFILLFDESSDEVQVACVGILPRILMHGTCELLIQTRTKWIQCIEYLLLHRKKAVRGAFSQQISYFLRIQILESLFVDFDESKTKEEKFLDTVKKALVSVEDPQILETLLESIAVIMNAVELHSKLFVSSLILLVDQLDNRHVTVRMTSSRFIQRSCQLHFNGGFEQALSKYFHIRDELFDYLSTKLVARPIMIREFAEAVVGIEVEELVRRMIPIVIPKLVMSQNNNVQAFTTLNELAKQSNTDLVTLIVKWLPKVLAFGLFRDDGEELFSLLNFYHIQTGSEKNEILAAALPGLLDELVCFSGDGDLEQTNKRIARVPQMIQVIARILTGSDDLPGFLKNHFVGLLNSIDRKMLHAEDLLLQKQALKHIEKLIEMMGSHLSMYVPKIMVLLMHSVEKETLQNEGLCILHFFVRQLAKVSPSSIKHVISQVVASLIPCLERYKENSSLHLEKVVYILEELVVQNRLQLKDLISELPLLPSIPSLVEVNKVIQEARGSLTLRDQLRYAVDGLNHESLNVRYMVACELSKLLNLRREEVASLIAAEVVSDLDVVSTLITPLLRGCAEESRTQVGQRLKLVCADCLGALGAVDPAKIKVVSCQRFKIQCSDDDLIFELIHKHLARAFRAASDAIVQDCAALAIQELLKVAGCQASLDTNIGKSTSEPLRVSENDKLDASKEMENRGQRLWDRFSNYVKDIIAPCLTSRFQLPNVAESTFLGPIYKPNMSFRRWISSWIRKLSVLAIGSRASIFNACRGIVRHDMPTATYLLPYLVLNAVCHGTPEARHGITEEILSVLNAVASENCGATLHGGAGGQREVCIQAVFTLLDNLGQWVDDVKQDVALSQSMNPTTSKQSSKTKPQNVGVSDLDELFMQCSNVSDLLTAIPKVTLAKASFRCKAYARSLLYFESHVRSKSGSFNPAAERSGVFDDNDVSFLMEIYSGLDEPDGLSGLAHLRKSASIHDQLLINEKAGNWAEVLTLCEQALQMEPGSVQKQSGVLNCFLNMCHLQAMVVHVDGLISRVPEYKGTWCMQGVQAAWRLGRWDLMNEYLCGADKEVPVSNRSAENNGSFDMNLAKILQAIMKKDQFMIAEKVAQSKQALLAPLAAAGMDSYIRAYPFVVKLHMLRELEDFHSLLGEDSFLEKSFSMDDPTFVKMIQDWDNRLKFTQPSLWAREPLLAFRRLVFSASGLGAQVGNCWLQYAKLCRSAGHYETANRAILEAQSSGASNVHIEKAKLLWATRKSDCAIEELQQSLLNMPTEILGSTAVSSLTSLSLVLPNPPFTSETHASNDNRDVAKILLLYSRWIHHTGQKQKVDVINLYSRVKELQPKWEKGYFFMAKYCDDLLVDARKRQEDNKEGLVGPQYGTRNISLVSATEEKPWWSYLPDVLLFYAKGLHRGHKNLFQALPRLLTLWFEFGAKYHREGLSSHKSIKAVHGKVMSIMRGCLKDLPTYQWLTVLSQLVSRICHHNEEIVRLVKLIITSVLQEYPQQALWTMAAVSKSTVAARRDAAAEIIQAARKGSYRGNDIGGLFVQFAGLTEHLIKLCFHSGQTKARTINIGLEFSALKRMMPLDIIMPIQQALTVTLPTYDESVTQSKIDIFSSTELATISGISDEAEILSSLQRPKKVIFLGSDGVKRPFLCKPKDDLRKDARMMEFTATINCLLSKYPESRRRKLYIRTFAVIPLTEDCGMVEWVPHTRGLRHILQDIYITSGKFDRQKTNPIIKRIYDQCQGKMPEDEMLQTKILPMFPPVFHRWFLHTFSEPAAWFRARVAYAHTTAVWSMVGHIVGLGDRHGENILFDSTTGDCVHVDFSCLFDKGLQLEKPELVPFRLTQNMIDGLGITGYEGIFLRVCEITLSVLRTHRETLLSVLETFIHDPLVEWTKSHKSSGVEVQNPHAQRAISNIEARLQGIVVGVMAAPSLPLAVEGQAHRLIAEAVSHKNLGKMYIWWMPWF